MFGRLSLTNYRANSAIANAAPTIAFSVIECLRELPPEVPAAPFPLAAGAELEALPVAVADATTWLPVAFEVGMAPPLEVDAAAVDVAGGIGILEVLL